jgi:hypothetical protein
VCCDGGLSVSIDRPPEAEAEAAVEAAPNSSAADGEEGSDQP